MFDLKELEFWELKKSIDMAHLPSIVSQLRKLSQPLSLDLIKKLADYLDPERPAIKCGPKPHEKSPGEYHLHALAIAGHYNSLCNDRELARFLLLHSDQEEFELEGDEISYDENGKFAPVWKYPNKARTRELVPFPKRGQIKDFVCKIYGISVRAFDDMLSTWRKRVVDFHNRLLEMDCPSDSAGARACERYKITPRQLERMLAKAEK